MFPGFALSSLYLGKYAECFFLDSFSAPPPLQDEYIIFLLDSSSAVRPEQFKIEKDFIKTLARYLNVGSTEKTKAAVVNYGSFPFTGVQFDGYSTLRDFQSGVDRMVPSKGL